LRAYGTPETMPQELRGKGGMRDTGRARRPEAHPSRGAANRRRTPTLETSSSLFMYHVSPHPVHPLFGWRRKATAMTFGRGGGGAGRCKEAGMLSGAREAEAPVRTGAASPSG
jgi:hypothetical protein